MRSVNNQSINILFYVCSQQGDVRPRRMRSSWTVEAYRMSASAQKRTSHLALFITVQPWPSVARGRQPLLSAPQGAWTWVTC